MEEDMDKWLRSSRYPTGYMGLKHAGIDAYPVLFDRRPVELVESVPTPAQFNDVMVAVVEEGGYRFLDPGAEFCLYGYYPHGGGNRALVVKPRGHELVTIPETLWKEQV